MHNKNRSISLILHQLLTILTPEAVSISLRSLRHESSSRQQQ